jgi:glycosyltransferase involved in cell wall biosynthesis
VRTVHVVVPDGIDDPSRPSGGNVYDRRVCASLPGAGWRVEEHPVPGAWPEPDAPAEQALAHALDRVPDEAVVVVDGLIASGAPSVLVPAARRLRLVVLVHLLFGAEPPGHRVAGARERERAVLGAARATVATSRWSRALILRTHPVEARRVHVAAPGTDTAPRAAGTPDGGQLLCVANVAWHKGHDVLLTALAGVRDLPWRCRCVGAPAQAGFAADLRRRADAAGLSDRLDFPGALTGSALDRAYASADVVVLPSRGETHGMVVGEALARGLPVIATAVGGVPDAVGRAADGRRPGLLVPPEDPEALAAALRRWLVEAPLRERLRQTAALRRTELPDWSTTARAIADVLSGAAA